MLKPETPAAKVEEAKPAETDEANKPKSLIEELPVDERQCSGRLQPSPLPGQPDPWKPCRSPMPTGSSGLPPAGETRHLPTHPNLLMLPLRPTHPNHLTRLLRRTLPALRKKNPANLDASIG